LVIKLYAENIEKHIKKVKDSLTLQSNFFDIIQNMWNVKEALHSEIVRGLLYRKFLLWKSMNMPIEEHVHSYVKNIID